MSIILFPNTNFHFPCAVLQISTLHIYVISMGEEFSLVSVTLDHSSAFHYLLLVWLHYILINANLPATLHG